MINFLNNRKHLHFVGIGGIGMSGMAEFLYNHGFKITGSDINKSDCTKHLSKYENIKIYYLHNKKNIGKCDLLIYSSAVNIDNHEIQEALKRKIPIMKRAELLGELIKIKDISIGVSGTHGKTTTSSMLGNILYEDKKDPTLIIGGIVNKFNSNNITGTGEIIVVEADEYDKSFLNMAPTYSIINNLDLEHLDSYNDLDDLLNSFVDFANSIPFYGKVAINIDSFNIKSISNKIKKSKVSFGIKENADVSAENISYKNNCSKFIVNFKNNTKKYKINLSCPGEHNIYNALAAITIAKELKISDKSIVNGLNNYSGVKRRFEIKHSNKLMIIDDYAHHPIEVEETIKAAKNGWNKRIISIFQPHLFSRTKNFYKEFAKALSKSEIIIITDIYPAREKPIIGITSKIIVDEIIDNKNTFYIPNKNNIPKKIFKIAKEDDIILIMGAGNINTIINSISAEYKNEN